MREVEFLPDWYPRVRKHKRLVILQAWITLILIAGLGLWMLLVQRNVRHREIELSSLSTDLFQSETEVQRLDDLLALQKSLNQQDDVFTKIGRNVESTRLMKTLEDLMPRSMALLDLSVDTEEVSKAPANSLAGRAAADKARANKKLRLRVHGVAPTDVDLADFLAKLTGKQFFSQVELIYSHERSQGGRLMREFEVAFAMDLAGIGAR